MGLADPFDAGAAIDAQARLMRDLLRRFAAVPLALAAYNAGPGPVAACGCVPPYPETRGYVARILGLLGGMGELGRSGRGGEARRLIARTLPIVWCWPWPAPSSSRTWSSRSPTRCGRPRAPRPRASPSASCTTPASTGRCTGGSASDYQWVDRLPWSDERWASYAGRVETHLVELDGRAAGYFELELDSARVGQDRPVRPAAGVPRHRASAGTRSRRRSTAPASCARASG